MHEIFRDQGGSQALAPGIESLRDLSTEQERDLLEKAKEVLGTEGGGDAQRTETLERVLVLAAPIIEQAAGRFKRGLGADYDDYVQDQKIKAITTRLEAYDPEKGRFSHYLARSTNLDGLDVLKIKKREVPELYERPLHDPSVDVEEEAIDSVCASEELDLEPVLSELQPARREVVEALLRALRSGEDVVEVELARELGISKSAFSLRKKRALEQMLGSKKFTPILDEIYSETDAISRPSHKNSAQRSSWPFESENICLEDTTDEIRTAIESDDPETENRARDETALSTPPETSDPKVPLIRRVKRTPVDITERQDVDPDTVMMWNLQKANQSKKQHAEIKKALNDNTMSLGAALNDPEAKTMSLEELLCSVPGLGETKLRMALEILKLARLTEIGTLDASEKSLLIRLFPYEKHQAARTGLNPNEGQPAALQKGTEMRQKKAMLKRRLAAMELTVSELFELDDESSARLKLGEVLASLPALQRSKPDKRQPKKRIYPKRAKRAERVLEALNLPTDKKCGALTPEERQAVLDHLKNHPIFMRYV